ncbi:MAG TPA: ECF-type sigma factor [Tahibacter sp.]|uniref:ECF-type sigma factor n=1 Tax=Tahibacter sp. TaxID=2056211 RepID=UPI002B5912D0|nr:ECF-type sigma factor [Tahibacter sp.]HSX62142.1 ECF-type sigma factor [Tahibacter sp.]
MSTYPNLDNAVDDAAGPMPGPSGGDAAFEQVYARLKAMASRQISRDRASTLNTTELVHELYERMTRQELQSAGGPYRFFAYAAHAMRNILIDRARHRLALKSGGDWIRVTVSASREEASYELALEVVALNDALDRLSVDDERAASVVELRYFAGLSMEQVAQALGVDRRTATRDWTYARAFLQAELADAPGCAANR